MRRLIDERPRRRQPLSPGVEATLTTGVWLAGIGGFVLVAGLLGVETGGRLIQAGAVVCGAVGGLMLLISAMGGEW
jgi:hypothetical protein